MLPPRITCPTALVAALILGASACHAQQAATLEVRGLVVDERGIPIQGAGFLVGEENSISVTQALRNPLTRSDKHGWIVATAPPAADQVRRIGILIAEGRACTLVPLDGPRVDFGTIALRPGVEIRGLVRTRKGQALAGARVLAVDIFKSRHVSVPLPEVCRTFATTDAQGKFTLVGVPVRGVSIRIRAEGYFDYRLQYINQYTPLVAQLTPSGRAAGIVGAGNQTIAGAGVVAHYEQHSGDWWSVRTIVRTDAKGGFELGLRYPGRYRLVSTPENPPRSTHWSKIFDGPQGDIRIEVRLPELAKGGIELRARAAKDGTRIKNFTASIVWESPKFFRRNGSYLAGMFKFLARKSGANGLLVHPGPAEGKPPTGQLLLRARGFAPKLIQEIQWDEEKRVKIDLTLEPESVITGTVVDTATGKSVGGATVRVTNVGDSFRRSIRRSNKAGTGAPNIAVTDAEGRFRIGMLGKGDYQVVVAHRGRPDAAAKIVSVGVGETKTAVGLSVPRGTTFRGTLTGARIGTGWRVKLKERAETNVIQLPTSTVVLPDDPEHPMEAAVGADGKFVLQGLSGGRFNLVLRIPYPLGTLDIPIDTIQVRGRDLKSKHAISPHLPGRLHGKVKTGGAAVAPGRLLVVANRIEKRRNQGGLQVLLFGLSRDHGVRAQVAMDGSFELPLRAGSYTLHLIDLATGVMLLKRARKFSIKPGSALELDLETQLAMVRVTLEPDKVDGRLVADRLEIRVQNQVPEPKLVRGRASDFDKGIGVDLQPGQREVTILVPAVETTLLVRSSSHELGPEKFAITAGPHGRATITPKLRKSNRIPIKVEEPRRP